MKIISARTVELAPGEASIKGQFDNMLAGGWKLHEAIVRIKELHPGMDPAFVRWMTGGPVMRAPTHILQVSGPSDEYEPPALFGPFDTVEEAQSFAEDFREANGLPREATGDNNDEWTNAGWYFGIFEPSTTIEKWN